MPEMNVLQAVNDALKVEMENDGDMVVFGEDVGKAGGVFRTTAELQDMFGPDRVFDTPLAESGIIGAAVGMAMYGLHPVAEIQFLDFIYPGFDQIVSEAAKMRYRSGGQFTCPMVIRSPYGGGIRGGHYHSQSSEAYFCHTPGLKVVIPATPADTKGLLISSIRDPDPVMFLEPKRLYRSVKGEVPEGEHTVEIGKARTAREGKDVTVIAYGSMLHVALDGARLAEERGIDAEVLDLRSLVPLDWPAIEESVKKTSRVVIVYEAPKTGGFGGEIAARIAEELILHLDGPILRVTGYDTPFPYTLEDLYLPTAERVLDALERVVNF